MWKNYKRTNTFKFDWENIQLFLYSITSKVIDELKDESRHVRLSETHNEYTRYTLIYKDLLVIPLKKRKGTFLSQEFNKTETHILRH